MILILISCRIMSLFILSKLSKKPFFLWRMEFPSRTGRHVRPISIRLNTHAMRVGYFEKANLSIGFRAIRLLPARERLLTWRSKCTTLVYFRDEGGCTNINGVELLRTTCTHTINLKVWAYYAVVHYAHTFR